jgi:hypothetical protein
MNDLSHEARALVAAARTVTVPAGPRRHHIKHSVLLRVAAVGATAAGAGVASATSLASKVVIGALLATVVTGGAYGVWQWRASVEAHSAHRRAREPARAREGQRTAPVARPAPDQHGSLGLREAAAPERKLAARLTAHASSAPEPAVRVRTEPVAVPPGKRDVAARPAPAWPAASTRAPIPVPASELVPMPASPAGDTLPAPVAASPSQEPVAGALPRAEAPLPAWPSALPRHRTGTAAPVPTTRAVTDQGTLLREVAALRRAHEALRAGKPLLALRVLADYDRDFPLGSLREERTAIAVIADCQAHPGPQARARAEEVLRQTPGAWLADGIRTACLQERGAK